MLIESIRMVEYGLHEIRAMFGFGKNTHTLHRLAREGILPSPRKKGRYLMLSHEQMLGACPEWQDIADGKLAAHQKKKALVRLMVPVLKDAGLLFTTRELSKLLQVNEETFRAWGNAGLLKGASFNYGSLGIKKLFSEKEITSKLNEKQKEDFRRLARGEKISVDDLRRIRRAIRTPEGCLNSEDAADLAGEYGLKIKPVTIMAWVRSGKLTPLVRKSSGIETGEELTGSGSYFYPREQFTRIIEKLVSGKKEYSPSRLCNELSANYFHFIPLVRNGVVKSRKEAVRGAAQGFAYKIPPLEALQWIRHVKGTSNRLENPLERALLLHEKQLLPLKEKLVAKEGAARATADLQFVAHAVMKFPSLPHQRRLISCLNKIEPSSLRNTAIIVASTVRNQRLQLLEQLEGIAATGENGAAINKLVSNWRAKHNGD